LRNDIVHIYEFRMRGAVILQVPEIHRTVGKQNGLKRSGKFDPGFAVPGVEVEGGNGGKQEPDENPHELEYGTETALLFSHEELRHKCFSPIERPPGG
jgi:hypothetical protein